MLYGIFGCGGFGREILDWQQAMFAESNTFSARNGLLSKFAVFVVSDGEVISERLVNGVGVLSLSEYLKLNEGPLSKIGLMINVAISNPQAKEQIAKLLADKGLSFYSIIHPTCNISPFSQVGVGAVFGPYSIVSTNTKVGINVHANFHSVISHDNIIGDNVTLAHGVKLSGWNIVGDRAYFGTNSCVKNGSAKRPIRIGRDAIIGAGSVVLTDVPDGETWVGVPAKRIKPVYPAPL